MLLLLLLLLLLKLLLFILLDSSFTINRGVVLSDFKLAHNSLLFTSNPKSSDSIEPANRLNIGN